jgi:hypothetical protein
VVLWPYRQDRLVLIVPQGHALAQRASVAFAEVLDQAFVMLHSGSAIHTFTMNAAAALGRHRTCASRCAASRRCAAWWVRAWASAWCRAAPCRVRA